MLLVKQTRVFIRWISLPPATYRSAGQTELNDTANDLKHCELVLQTTAWNGCFWQDARPPMLQPARQ